MDLRSLDLHDYRRQLGYVPQEAFLFTGTVRDNIAYGRPEARRRGRGGRQVGRGPRVHLSGYLAGTTTSCPSGGGRSPRASASSSPWPGPSSSTRRYSFGRGNLQPRPRHRSTCHRRHAARLPRTHDRRHRPPAADGEERRPHRGARTRDGSSRSAPTTSSSPWAGDTPRCGRPSSSSGKRARLAPWPEVSPLLLIANPPPVTRSAVSRSNERRSGGLDRNCQS